jgi:alkylresorcinol/alkylpyrone synthase
LHQRFLAHAPRLALQAARNALMQAGLPAEAFGAVVVSTCTGYVCPGLSGYVIEGLSMRRDVLAFDLVGQGCAAALPNMQLGRALLASGQCQHVLSVCVEVSSAAMYLDNDAGVLVSACLFGDGAGAAVLSQQPAPRTRSIEWLDSASFINPSERQALMFEQRQGLLRNVLTRAVPQLAANAAKQVFEGVMTPAGLEVADVSAWILHAGGRDVLLALAHRFELEDDALRYSAAMLRQYGNLSSAFVYFVLQAAVADEAPGGWWWLSSFGAGFSCHGALLKVA